MTNDNLIRYDFSCYAFVHPSYLHCITVSGMYVIYPIMFIFCIAALPPLVVYCIVNLLQNYLMILEKDTYGLGLNLLSHQETTTTSCHLMEVLSNTSDAMANALLVRSFILRIPLIKFACLTSRS